MKTPRASEFHNQVACVTLVNAWVPNASRVSDGADEVPSSQRRWISNTEIAWSAASAEAEASVAIA